MEIHDSSLPSSFVPEISFVREHILNINGFRSDFVLRDDMIRGFIRTCFYSGHIMHQYTTTREIKSFLVEHPLGGDFSLVLAFLTDFIPRFLIQIERKESSTRSILKVTPSGSTTPRVTSPDHFPIMFRSERLDEWPLYLNTPLLKEFAKHALETGHSSDFYMEGEVE